MRPTLTIALIVSLTALPAFAQNTQIAIRLDIDPAVSARLIKMGEWITVSAHYFGDPASDAAPLDDVGQVHLGTEQATIYPVSQTVVIGGGFGGTPDDWVSAPYVNVNVFTARYVDELNLISCGIVDDQVSVVAGADNVISCVWLGE